MTSTPNAPPDPIGTSGQAYSLWKKPFCVRHSSAALALGLAFTITLVLFGADHYKLSNVKRLDQDLYRTSDGLYIETQYCYHYTYGEEAVLKWDGPYSMDNKIIWDDDSTCKVKKVWKK